MKRVLVTGASRGIGHAISEKLLAGDMSVIGTSRNPQSIDISHPNLKPVYLDLSEIVDNKNSLIHFSQQCGELDAIILNAGQGRFGGLEEFSAKQIQDQIQQNLLAQMILVREFIQAFKSRGSGDIVFIGSESALSAGKMGSVYSAAKFGLRGFSQALRQECAPSNIRVALINPGMVASSFFDDLSFMPATDPDNSILPEQVADAILLILTSASNVVWDEINLSPLKKVVVKKQK